MFRKLSEGFFLPSGLLDLAALENLPEIDHTYGDDVPDFHDFCWMNYRTFAGKISFTRNTHLNLPVFSEYVADYLSNLLKTSISPELIHVMRTQGSIMPHRDESDRLSCVNIGLKNANSAITRVSLDDSKDTINERYEEYVCEDGSVYLLDTSRVHMVISKKPGPRYLITCGFNKAFSTLMGGLK